MRPLESIFASAFLALLATAAAADVVQSSSAVEPLTLTPGPRSFCVERLGSEAACFGLPALSRLRAVEPDGDGWIAAGVTWATGSARLLLLAGGDGDLELLPEPAGQPREARWYPVPLIEGGRLAGLAWLEGADQQEMTVWAARWTGTGWEDAVQVSGRGPGPQLALAGTVLGDGRQLLVWAAFDGDDDEILYSVGERSGWTEPAAVLADNAVFDLTPAVAATDGGALALWSRFDGNDYRLVSARFDGRRWREGETWPGRGAGQARFTRMGGGLQALYGGVEPPAWNLVRLDRRGAVDGREEIPRTLYGPMPVVGLERGRPVVAVPEPDAAEKEPAGPLDEAAEGASTFRYMAFGDSITNGVGCGNGTNYPNVLDDPAYLNCGANNCQVVNKGKPGETTSQGISRIQQLLDNEGPWDVVILMEGTNDICFNNSISNQGIQNNLNAMETHARTRGVDTLHATVIDLNPEGEGPGGDPEFPCPGDLGREDDMTVRTRDNLANVDADTGYRWWANTRSDLSTPPEVTSPKPLCDNSQSCMDTYFADWGHPNCSGYPRLADEIRDGVVGKPVPVLPTATGPSGTISDTHPLFKWTKEIPRNATWYQFQLEGPAVVDLWRIETEICGAWACTLDVGALPEGSYTWRLRGRNPRGRSGWRETTFTIVTLLPPGVPDPQSPAGLIGDDRPALVWRAETPQVADTYQLEVRNALGQLVSDTSWSAATACQGTTCTGNPFVLGDPLPDGDYRWRARGSNAAGTGPWSPELAFEVIAGLIFSDGFESGDTSAWTTTSL